jgi:UDP-2,3-diacylglucosamine pyrophosphatase LpxH
MQAMGFSCWVFYNINFSLFDKKDLNTQNRIIIISIKGLIMINNFYNSIFLSDTHLSTKGCNHENLTNFLSNFYAPTIYLVGDMIDLWKLKTAEEWPDEHTQLLLGFLQLCQDGSHINYITGNHDEFFENIQGSFLALTIMKEAIVQIGSKKLLVVHGHKYDLSIRYFKWIGKIGTSLHDFFKKNTESTFSLKEYLKEHPSHITKFEKYILEDVKKRGLDGVICGHTHKPNIVMRDNLLYVNTGDFVENSSFIVQKDNKLILMAYENDRPVIVQEIEL